MYKGIIKQIFRIRNTTYYLAETDDSNINIFNSQGECILSENYFGHINREYINSISKNIFVYINNTEYDNRKIELLCIKYNFYNKPIKIVRRKDLFKNCGLVDKIYFIKRKNVLMAFTIDNNNNNYAYLKFFKITNIYNFKYDYIAEFDLFKYFNSVSGLYHIKHYINYNNSYLFLAHDLNRNNIIFTQFDLESFSIIKTKEIKREQILKWEEFYNQNKAKTIYHHSFNQVYDMKIINNSVAIIILYSGLIINFSLKYNEVINFHYLDSIFKILNFNNKDSWHCYKCNIDIDFGKKCNKCNIIQMNSNFDGNLYLNENENNLIFCNNDFMKYINIDKNNIDLKEGNEIKLKSLDVEELKNNEITYMGYLKNKKYIIGYKKHYCCVFGYNYFINKIKIINI